jgi:hypothetical protein
LVLSSPIVRFRDDIPAWTPGLVRLAATTLPLARVSLETLMGGQEVRVTGSTVHAEQARTNPYHVEHYTLRLIGTLLLGICFLREAPERAIGTDRRARKWGFFDVTASRS